MEININIKIFTKIPWKNRSIDYSKCEYLPDKNSNSNENMFFLRKTDETIWNPPFLREKQDPPPPFNIRGQRNCLGPAGSLFLGEN